MSRHRDRAGLRPVPADDLNLLAHPAFDYDRRLRRVKAHVLPRIGEPLRRSDLAAAACCDSSHLSRLFSLELGVGVMEWVRRVRVTAAMNALKHTDASIDEVAATVGFGSTRSLQRAFSTWVGCAPGEYRRGVRGTSPASQPR